jgi:hypothetical protein
MGYEAEINFQALPVIGFELISEIIGDVQCVTLLALKTPHSWTSDFYNALDNYYIHI